MSLFAASVPPALQALERGRGLLDLATPVLLAAQLAPRMLNTAGQLRTVASFALRATYPLTGQSAPSIAFYESGSDLRACFQKTTRLILALDPTSFSAETVTHRAGFADLTQTGADYLNHFALPNLWFHLSMAYATLRASGVPLGKADFDGLHSYPTGFSF